MKDSRIGESLWFIWDGDGYTHNLDGSIVFYTEEHIDVDNETDRRALASSIQREGIVSSLSHAFNLIDIGTTWHGYVGILPIEHIQVACDENGETSDGDFVENIIPVTWVEVLEF